MYSIGNSLDSVSVCTEWIELQFSLATVQTVLCVSLAKYSIILYWIDPDPRTEITPTIGCSCLKNAKCHGERAVFRTFLKRAKSFVIVHTFWWKCVCSSFFAWKIHFWHQFFRKMPVRCRSSRKHLQTFSRKIGARNEFFMGKNVDMRIFIQMYEQLNTIQGI